jgi:hypothetical protein
VQHTVLCCNIRCYVATYVLQRDAETDRPGLAGGECSAGRVSVSTPRVRLDPRLGRMLSCMRHAACCRLPATLYVGCIGCMRHALSCTLCRCVVRRIALAYMSRSLISVSSRSASVCSQAVISKCCNMTPRVATRCNMLQRRAACSADQRASEAQSDGFFNPRWTTHEGRGEAAAERAFNASALSCSHATSSSRSAGSFSTCAVHS